MRAAIQNYYFSCHNEAESNKRIAATISGIVAPCPNKFRLWDFSNSYFARPRAGQCRGLWRSPAISGHRPEQKSG